MPTEEYSFLMLKPDALERDVVDEALTYFLETDLCIPALKKTFVTSEIVDDHYGHVRHEAGEEIFQGLHKYFDNEEVVAALVYGEDAIEETRRIVGPDMVPSQNDYGTIRGDIHNPESPLYWENGIDDREYWENRYDWDKTPEGEPSFNLAHAADPEEDNPQEIAEVEAARFFGGDIINYLD